MCCGRMRELAIDVAAPRRGAGVHFGGRVGAGGSRGQCLMAIPHSDCQLTTGRVLRAHEYDAFGSARGGWHHRLERLGIEIQVDAPAITLGAGAMRTTSAVSSTLRWWARRLEGIDKSN